MPKTHSPHRVALAAAIIAAGALVAMWGNAEKAGGVEDLATWAGGKCEALGLEEVFPAKDGRPAMCTHGEDEAVEGVSAVTRLHRDEDGDPDQYGRHHDAQAHHDGPLHLHTESDAETLVAAAEEDPHIAEAGRDWDSHCIGNGADGYRVELIYMRPQGAAGTYEAQVEAIRNYAYDASEIFHDSASKTGGRRHIRYLTDHGEPGCRPVVHNLDYPGTNPSYSQIFAAAEAAGFNKGRRRYLIFYDGGGGCGIGTLYGDDRADPSVNYNAVPEHTGYSIAWKPCWSAHTAAHELAHNFGAVQSTAPNKSAAWHCVDEHDVMCYPDGPGVVMQYICPPAHEFLLDCGDNDYYAHTPKGEYLEAKWNVANSPFLHTPEHDHPGDGGGGDDEDGGGEDDGGGGDGGGEGGPTPNTLPSVSITAPENGAVISSLMAPIWVGANGSATDAEDGNLGNRIRWNVVGHDGYQWGQNPVWLLPEGVWTIRARVEDNDGGVAWAQVTVETKAQNLNGGEDGEGGNGGEDGDDEAGNNESGDGDRGGGGDGVVFEDTTSSVFAAEIAALAEAGITRGCNPPQNDRFCPGEAVTRGQMAAFLVRALRLPPSSGGGFTDTAGVFHFDIAALAEAGITKGCNPPQNDRFCPGEAVTRGQMAAFLVRALGLDTGETLFTDTGGHVFASEIAALAEAGITKGCNPPRNDRFCPDDPVTRGQMAAFLVRALGL